MDSLETSRILWEATKTVVAAETPDLVLAVESTNWIIINTRDTHTNAHCDSQGAVTWIRIENDMGKKAWAVPGWKSQHQVDRRCMFSSTLLADFPHMPPAGPIKEWETVVLSKGDTL